MKKNTLSLEVSSRFSIKEIHYFLTQKKSIIKYYSFIFHIFSSSNTFNKNKLTSWTSFFDLVKCKKNNLVPKALAFTTLKKLFTTKTDTITQPTRAIFLVFSRLMFKNINFFFKPHKSFKAFFNLTNRVGLIQVDTKIYFHRWLNGHLLIINIFFFNLTLLVLGNKFLWRETLTLNWLHYNFNDSIFKVLKNKFFFKDHNPSSKTESIFNKLKTISPDSFLVLNASTHKSNLFFLKKLGVFTIGFISVDNNPWLLSYPIPIFNQNLVVQYFLFQLMLFSFSKAKSLKFNLIYQYWSTNL